jgi:hypothetical protein
LIGEVDLQNAVVVAVEEEELAFHFDWFDNLTRKVVDWPSFEVVVEGDREERNVHNPLEPGYSDAKSFEGRYYIPHSIEGWEALRA